MIPVDSRQPLPHSVAGVGNLLLLPTAPSFPPLLSLKLLTKRMREEAPPPPPRSLVPSLLISLPSLPLLLMLPPVLPRHVLLLLLFVFSRLALKHFHCLTFSCTGEKMALTLGFLNSYQLGNAKEKESLKTSFCRLLTKKKNAVLNIALRWRGFCL